LTNSARNGCFFCTRDHDLGKKFNYLSEERLHLRQIDLSGAYPEETSKEELIYIRSTFEEGAESVTTHHGIHCWNIESNTETGITEMGIKYAKIAFQIEEYSSGLTQLEKSLNAKKVGLEFWKTGSISRFVSEASYLRKLIDHEISRILEESDLPQDVTIAGHKLKELLEKVESVIERKKGHLEAEKQKIKIYYFILGTLTSLFFFILRYIIG